MLGKTTTLALLIGLYLALFLGLNILHFRLLSVTVVLYAALFDAVLAALVLGMTLALRQEKPSVTRAETVLALCVGFLLAVIYSIMVPTLLDRSLSVYILDRLHRDGNGIKEAIFTDLIAQDYFTERGVLDARLTEQLESGTIVIEHGCIRLTSRGKLIARFSQFYREALLPKHRESRGPNLSARPFNQLKLAAPPTCE